MPTVKIEGWLAFPQSLSVVNQFQCLELMRRDGVRLFHEEVPGPPPGSLLSRNSWKKMTGLLPPVLEDAVYSIGPMPGGMAPDITYRIFFPYDHTPAPAGKTIIFSVTEYGLQHGFLMAGGRAPEDVFRESDATIVTPSEWSKRGLVNSGAPPERVIVIPHGFDPAIHRPAKPDRRAELRRAHGLEGQFVFLAVGAMYPRKGVAPLLKAFAAVAAKHPNVRLLLKGLDDIYASKAAIKYAGRDLSPAEAALIKPRMRYLGKSLQSEAVAELYQLADVFVSPYFAEGFNMPVLEAVACGTPVICTAGGPTDDFTEEDFALRIDSAPEPAPDRPGTWLRPDVDHLAALMIETVEDSAFVAQASTKAADHALKNFTWEHAVDRLVDAMKTLTGDEMPVSGGEETVTEVTTVGETADHRIGLAHGWDMWRTVLLRSAGFPASRLDVLATPQAAAAVDHLLDVEAALDAARQRALELCSQKLETSGGVQHKAWWKTLKRLAKGHVPEPPEPAPAFDALVAARRQVDDLTGKAELLITEDIRRLATSMREIARDSYFREAVAWQNRSALKTGIDVLLNSPPESRNQKIRKHERLLANYLQRYCAKNETIGFFGPVAWAEMCESGPAAGLEVGQDLISVRKTKLEHWPLHVLTRIFSADAQLKPWLKPRLNAQFRVQGDLLITTSGQRAKLNRISLAVIEACDGRTRAGDIAARLVAAGGTGLEHESQVMGVLEVLQKRGAIIWDFALPIVHDSEDRLWDEIRAIGEAPLRDRLMADFGALAEARDVVDAASGNGAAVEQAIERLEGVFSAGTDVPAVRSHGGTYAGRTLVYQDCRRDIAALFGPRLLDGVREPLALIYDSARWFTHKAAQRTLKHIEEIYEDLRPRLYAVPLHVMLDQFNGPEPPIASIIAEVADELAAEWAAILGLSDGSDPVKRSSSEIRERVGGAFAAPGPGWPAARFHSPDIMIAAESVAAINEGRFTAVLGEVHAGTNMHMTPMCLTMHPDFRSLVSWAEYDNPEPRVHWAVPPEYQGHRRARDSLAEEDFQLALDHAATWRSQDRVLRIADLLIERSDDGFLVRTRDNTRRLDALAVLEGFVIRYAMEGFRLLPAAPHLPRVTIDRLVIHRDSWETACSGAAFAFEKSETGRYIAARRWAHGLGLPRRVFVRLPQELKPIYVDFDSTVSVEILCHLARRAKKESPEKTIRISEMLPTPDQLWLTDASGARYASELRMVAVDPERWRSPPRSGA